MITTQEASEISSYSVVHLRELLREGKINGANVGGRIWLVDEADLRRYMRTVKRGRPKAS